LPIGQVESVSRFRRCFAEAPAEYPVEVRQISESGVVRYRTDFAETIGWAQQQPACQQQPLLQHEFGKRHADLFEEPLRVPGTYSATARD
jgi:hypothetical protein